MYFVVVSYSLRLCLPACVRGVVRRSFFSKFQFKSVLYIVCWIHGIQTWKIYRSTIISVNTMCSRITARREIRQNYTPHSRKTAGLFTRCAPFVDMSVSATYDRLGEMPALRHYAWGRNKKCSSFTVSDTIRKSMYELGLHLQLWSRDCDAQFKCQPWVTCLFERATG